MSFGRGSAYAFTALQLIARGSRSSAPDGAVMVEVKPPIAGELQDENATGSSTFEAPVARGVSTSAHTIADQTGIPLEYLRKILQRLARARLIVSERGRRGGFLLARNPNSITMLDVMQAVDGDLDDATLLNDGVIDRTGAAAPGLRLWRAKAARDLRATLGQIALVELVGETPSHDAPEGCNVASHAVMEVALAA